MADFIRRGWLPGWAAAPRENDLPSRNPTETEIRDWCVAYIERTLGDPSIPVAPDISFPGMGLDSANSAYFVVELEEWLGVELEPEIVAEHPTIAELAHHLAARLAGEQ